MRYFICVTGASFGKLNAAPLFVLGVKQTLAFNGRNSLSARAASLPSTEALSNGFQVPCKFSSQSQVGRDWGSFPMDMLRERPQMLSS